MKQSYWGQKLTLNLPHFTIYTVGRVSLFPKICWILRHRRSRSQQPFFSNNLCTSNFPWQNSSKFQTSHLIQLLSSLRLNEGPLWHSRKDKRGIVGRGMSSLDALVCLMWSMLCWSANEKLSLMPQTERNREILCLSNPFTGARLMKGWAGELASSVYKWWLLLLPDASPCQQLSPMLNREMK